MLHAETESNLDGHLTFYLLLSGFRNNQNFCFNFLTSCPLCIYLYLAHQPPTPCTNTQMDCRPFGNSGLGTIRGKRETPRGFT